MSKAVRAQIGAMDGDWLAKLARPPQTRIRWGWIAAISLGCLLGLLLAASLGETGARLGAPDAFDAAPGIAANAVSPDSRPRLPTSAGHPMHAPTGDSASGK